MVNSLDDDIDAGRGHFAVCLLLSKPFGTGLNSKDSGGGSRNGLAICRIAHSVLVSLANCTMIYSVVQWFPIDPALRPCSRSWHLLFPCRVLCLWTNSTPAHYSF